MVERDGSCATRLGPISSHDRSMIRAVSTSGRPPIITRCDGLPPTLVDTAGNLTPAAGDPRDARVQRLAGNTQHSAVCVTGKSLRCSGDSCAQARGRLGANRAIVDILNVS